jgi:integrase
VKAMTEKELRQILAAIERSAPGWSLFYWFLAWSGLRIGEAIELGWKDIDLGQRIVHVRRRYFAGRFGPPKSKYGKRRVRLTPELARALWRFHAETKAGDDELVFTAGRSSRVDASNLMRRVLKPAAAEAGLGEWVPDGRKLRADSWVGFHTFRHTCATILFRRGWKRRPGPALARPPQALVHAGTYATCSMRTCPSRCSSMSSAPQLVTRL